ncbi:MULTISPECIES: hypothetical protein [Burkholderia]|uniref:Uncharacterized protein n=1 Tax=Burkholderia anthina TaxID=179879 RepID=A0A7T6VI80_9BURK|nr:MULTISPECIES: hypothetical protein [Burkholderia]QQK04355.1 hypothetical protein JFN94_23625 [Burkholderia anthina]
MPESRLPFRTAFEPPVVLPALAVIGASFFIGRQSDVARFGLLGALAVTIFAVFLAPIAANGFGDRPAGEPRTGPRDKDRMNNRISRTPSPRCATIDGAAQ